MIRLGPISAIYEYEGYVSARQLFDDCRRGKEGLKSSLDKKVHGPSRSGEGEQKFATPPRI